MRKKSKSPAVNKANQDPLLALSLEAALVLFRAEPTVTLAQVAHAVDLSGASEPEFSSRYPSTADWLAAFLKHHEPTSAFEAAIAAVKGDDAADLLRDAMRRMIELTSRHMAYFELALIEADVYHGNTLNTLTGRILPAANVLLQRVKETNQLRPLPDWLIARALIALLIGFVASERAMPSGVKFAARLMPQRMWVDSLTDILLYGLIEDDARG